MSDKEVGGENLFGAWGWISTDCVYLAQALLDWGDTGSSQGEP
jgi:hypothetical protein